MKIKTRGYGRIGRFMICFFLLLCLFYPQRVYAEKTDPVNADKNGVVEVYSGFMDGEGNFHRLKNGSGFLISNREGETYIVTNSSLVKNSKKKKASYCKKNGIDTDSYQMTDVIHIVIRGDVTEEASILTESRELDFCILHTDSVVNEKNSLKLGDNSSIATGNNVYALGFPEDVEGLDFSSSDVEVYQGTVQDKEASQSGNSYIQHSAVISSGNTGGPLLDGDGYVVGINCKKYSDDSSDRYYSLPVDALAEVLDNFAIDYDSRERDVLRDKLETLRQECGQLYESGKYKRESLTKLQSALDEANQLAEEEFPSTADMEMVFQNLENAKEQLVPKAAKTRIFIYILAGIILLLFIHVLYLLISNHKGEAAYKEENTNRENASRRETKREGNGQPAKEEKEQPKKKEAETAREGFVHEEERQFPEEERQIPEEDMEKTVRISPYSRKGNVRQNKDRTFSDRKYKLELLRKNNMQSVVVDKPEYIIGHNPNQADYFISDNNTVSRKHACISWKKGEYYICDLGSSNGTYVRGERVPNGIPVKIEDGDEIMLSDEEFIIKIFEEGSEMEGRRQ